MQGVSVDYMARPARDLDLLENEAAGTPFDHAALVAKIRAAIPSFEASGGGEAMGLDWIDEDEGAYIQAHLTRHAVGVSHGRGGDSLMATLTTLFDVLRDNGLHIFDPQQGDWLE